MHVVVDETTVLPSEIRRTSPIVRSTSSMPIPAVGSSSSITLGSTPGRERSRAPVSGRRRSARGHVRQPVRPTWRAAVDLGACRPSSFSERQNGAPGGPALERELDVLARVRFSKRLVIWNDRATPLRAICSGWRPVTSSSKTVIVPAGGLRKPVSRLNRVVLPAPLGPTSAWTPSLATSRSTELTALKPRKSLVSPSVRRAVRSSRSLRSCSSWSCLWARGPGVHATLGRSRATGHGDRSHTGRLRGVGGLYPCAAVGMCQVGYWHVRRTAFWRRAAGSVGSSWIVPPTLQEQCSDRSRRHQRLRPDRPQLLPRRPRPPAERGPRPRDRRGQRPDRPRRPRAAAEVRLDPRPARRRRAGQRGPDRGGRQDRQGLRRARPGQPQVGRRGRRRGRRVHRLLHRRHQGARARRQRRCQEGDHLRAGVQRGLHRGDGRQPRGLRPGRAHRDLQRVLHDQLPGADGEGPPRRVRDRQGADDHRARLHRGPEPPGQHPQGPAPGPRGRDQRRPDLDRCRQGDRPGAARAQGQARRLRPAGAGPDRLGDRPHLRGRARHLGRRGQRGRRRRRPTAATCSTPPTRWSPATSSPTRRPASSTPRSPR